MDKMLKMVATVALTAGVVAVVASPTHAQTIEIGRSAAASVPGATVAHADQVSVGVKDGNLTVTGAAADGVRIGDGAAQAGVTGSVSLPVPTRARPILIPTAAQVLQPVTAPIQALKKLRF